MTSSRRSSRRLARRSLPNTPSKAEGADDPVTPAQDSTSFQKRTRKEIKKSSKRFLSKFTDRLLEEIASQSNTTTNSSSTTLSSRNNMRKKVRKHLLQKISEASKTSFITDEFDTNLLKQRIEEKQQKIEGKIKQLSHYVTSQITRSKLSTLPRLPDVGYESGQFEEKVSAIGEKINKISMDLSNATKQLEERVVSFDQTYSIIKGNVDHLIVQQQQQLGALSGESRAAENRAPFAQDVNLSKGKDPLQKLHDHLSEK
eukprot:gene4515-4839_t